MGDEIRHESMDNPQPAKELSTDESGLGFRLT